MTSPTDNELREKIVAAINSLDWTQAEFGYVPSDDDFVEVLLPVFTAHTQAQTQRAVIEARIDELGKFIGIVGTIKPSKYYRERYAELDKQKEQA